MDYSSHSHSLSNGHGHGHGPENSDSNETQLSPSSASPSDERSRRIVSQQSSLGVPHSSDAARSSFMTNTSGMSRLSDFPAPPSLVAASHLSILNAYYGEGSRGQSVHEDIMDGSGDGDGDADADQGGRGGRSGRPGLVREASQATFGRQQMGEAL